jgi:hypothetical protein
MGLCKPIRGCAVFFSNRLSRTRFRFRNESGQWLGNSRHPVTATVGSADLIKPRTSSVDRCYHHIGTGCTTSTSLAADPAQQDCPPEIPRNVADPCARPIKQKSRTRAEQPNPHVECTSRPLAAVSVETRTNRPESYNQAGSSMLDHATQLILSRHNVWCRRRKSRITASSKEMAPRAGLEPATQRLTAACSTD